jgi:hypothetical protein
MIPSCDEWTGCTRVLGGFRPLGRFRGAIRNSGGLPSHPSRMNNEAAEGWGTQFIDS